ncbi:Cytochrome b561 eukaryote [Lasiodiplodia theobromae]|uniref:DOMON domain-containing protein n=1 Tax=Lasiodiplodia theobromae TaxID=45133 RepID=A0A5N5CZT1_9PEZI|nr:Cytochrome b561 [Lasiodiplodia theobromae]KAB2570909.1 hypothetical protein DBV05_g10427 [Lasiodiplodia theobromae]KAF4542068.1 Cytochrome b561 [Lasiodiplodia theobromae]KAF9635497.1 Cytochrome b561 eukaryote [Lasiodiplodia theobromae]
MALRRLAIALAALVSNAAASTALDSRQASQPKSATFVSSASPWDANLTFSLTATNTDDAVDLYLHLSAPDDCQWVAVGVGARMKDALIFLVYHDSSGNNVTFSPRVATGESEPTYRSSIACSVYQGEDTPRVGILEDPDTDGDRYSVNAHCRDVKSSVPELALDLSSKTQPFIYAIGPWSHGLYSDSKRAGIRRHRYYGGFTMDMTVATEPNATDAGKAFGTQMKDATPRDGPHEDDGSRGSGTHAVFMCGTFLFIFPIGVVLLRSFERVKWHAGTQTGGLLVVCAGVGLGIWVSKFYNKSKKFDSVHQIIGLIVFALLFVQLGLGWFHHRIFMRSQSPTMMGTIHRYLGPSVLGAGLANGFIGFRFAGAGRSNIIYLLLVLVMFVILIVGVWYKRRKDRRKAAAAHLGPPAGPPPPANTAPPPYSGPDPSARAGAYAESQASRSDIALGDMGQNNRDLYYEQPTQPRAMV